MADVHTGGDLILHKGVLHRPTLGIVGDVLGQGHADPLQDAALSLHTGQVGVDGGAAVHAGGIIHHLDLAGLLVQLNFSRADHVGRGRKGRGVGLSDLQRHHVAELGGEGHLRERDPLLRVCVQGDELAVKIHSIFGRLEQLRAQLADLAAQPQGTLLHCLAGDIGGRGSVGAGIIGRGIGIRAKDSDIVQVTVQHLGGDLSQRGVTAGAHIGSADDEGVESVIVYLEGGAAHVHAGNAGALHGHAHTHGAHLAIAKVAHRVLVVPVDHLVDFFQAAVQRAAGVHSAVIGRHHIALFDDVHFTDLEGVHVESGSQLVDSRFHRKQALCRTIAAVRTGRHVVGVDHVADKTEGFGLAIQRNRLVTGKAHRCGAVLAVGTGV